MRERAWQAMVVSIAKAAGFKVYHTYDSRRSESGFPDLCLMKPPRLIFAELKADDGKLTKAQQEWLLGFLDCGIEATIWRPEHLDEVERVLIHGEKIDTA